MRQKSGTTESPSERIVKNIRSADAEHSLSRMVTEPDDDRVFRAWTKVHIDFTPKPLDTGNARSPSLPPDPQTGSQAASFSPRAGRTFVRRLVGAFS